MGLNVDETSGYPQQKKARVDGGNRTGGLDVGSHGPSAPHAVLTPQQIHLMHMLQQNSSSLNPQQQSQLKYLQNQFHLMSQHQKVTQQKFTTPAQIPTAPDNKQGMMTSQPQSAYQHHQMSSDPSSGGLINQNIPRIHHSSLLGPNGHQQQLSSSNSVQTPQQKVAGDSIRSTAASFLSEMDLETLLYPKESPAAIAQELINGELSIIMLTCGV